MEQDADGIIQSLWRIHSYLLEVYIMQDILILVGCAVSFGLGMFVEKALERRRFLAAQQQAKANEPQK